LDLLPGSMALGAAIRPLLPEEQKARETVERVQFAAGMARS
jgi:hypothetical protein